MLESVIGWAQDFFEGIIGKENKGYIPYLMTVALYLAISNVIGLLGFKPPTKDMNVTIALAVMSMFVIEFPVSIETVWFTGANILQSQFRSSHQS